MSISCGRADDRFYFDCTPWSDFIGEDEKLFIGGLQVFDFQTIRNMSTTPTQNYKLYVQAMGMFHYIVEGYRWKNAIKIKKGHAKALELLITTEIEKEYATSSKSDCVVPRYVQLLWHHFLQKIGDLEVDWGYFKERNNWYSHLVPILSDVNGSALNLDIFLRCLPNVQSVHVFSGGRKKKNNISSGFIAENEVVIRCQVHQ